jgi:hypothetical protein
MRHLAVAVLGLALGLLALSDSASARPRGLSGVFGFITKPLGTILRPPRAISRQSTYRRPAAARTRQARPSEIQPTTPAHTPPAGVVAPAAAAAGVGGAATAVANAGAAASVEPAPTAPSPTQRRAAVSQPGDEQHSRSRSTAPSEPGQAVQPAASHLGLGPSNWPTAFEDVVGFALWPGKYGERLRTHGIGDVMTALFAPGAPGNERALARAKRESRTASETDGATSTCAADQQEASDWPAKTLEQAMTLNEVQRAALDQFRTAMRDAIAALRAACRADAPRTSADRLQAMQKTLWTVRDAAMLVRAPLINFYRSLGDEQGKQFVIQTRQPDPRLAQMQQRTADRHDAKPQIPRELARMCGISAANEWPRRQIEQAIEANKQQKASLDRLQKKSTEMGQLLIASCLQPIAATPEARLDQALDRLTTMLFAITNITLALNDFHGQLSDDQKAALEPFGL